MHELPPLNSLRVFEACARIGNFTRAAGELGLTQSAVSRQIQLLESRLNLQLFRRKGRRVHLTQEGQDYQVVVRRALEMIADETQRLSRKPRADTLVVSTVPSFAVKWLAPRLQRFQHANEDIDLRISTSYEHTDFDRDGVDVAVRYGAGGWSDLHVERLAEELVFPVCGPGLAEREGLQQPADLLEMPLLHGEVTEGWSDWFRLAGVAVTTLPEGPRFKDSCALIQAAIDGQGVTLAQRSLVEADLREGRLMQPFPTAIRSRHAYYLVCPPRALRRAKVAAFRDWVGAEMARPGDAGPGR
ncbi:MAG: transcriptional regulator GcvA [Alphaproteobacteria bacterium]|jgi:LysR family glycine cleavage system transcriptional activator|nr:transcriptional regulator GcvA [Alphaproteobacteria bacterium]MDP6564479.1 transcriptional regulator GcvA [Alphaproteobacteria bacterium]MDP6814696.1 transcriptional regulator GcvA [Alphaproteobacteria bacterium]